MGSDVAKRRDIFQYRTQAKEGMVSSMEMKGECYFPLRFQAIMLIFPQIKMGWGKKAIPLLSGRYITIMRASKLQRRQKYREQY